MKDLQHNYRTWLVWALRLAVGALFIFSGFAKIVDPWGFMYKVEDYLLVWGIDWMPREIVVLSSAILSMVEFSSGVLLLLGCMRRVVPMILLAFMCVMLPLTAYIAIANPVDDCGCFGDAWVISNTATFLKNLVLTLAIVYLLRANHKVPGLVIPLLQWLPASACLAYCVVVGVIGYWVQPIIDFRPYPVGSSMVADDADVKLIYQKGGEKKAYGLSELPDSTWTYVGRDDSAHDTHHGTLAILDGDDDVTADLISDDGLQLILAVPEPRLHSRGRASMANQLNEYVTQHGGSMIGVVALSGDRLESWKEMTNPDFDVYTADDTALKELARGNASLILLRDGVIQWKRNIYSFEGDFPDFSAEGNVLEQVAVVDSGSLLQTLTLMLAAVLVLSGVLGLPSVVAHRERLRRRLRRNQD